MAKRRTRKEKMIARLRHQLARNQASIAKKTQVDQPVSISPRKPTTSHSKLFLYNPTLIKNDLVKTGLYSLLFVALILGLYWYFELGGQPFLAKLFPSLPL